MHLSAGIGYWSWNILSEHEIPVLTYRIQHDNVGRYLGPLTACLAV